ncbi:MAG: transketolase C-terminal domain-containing protein [Anaerolineae bacterium]
MATQRMVSVAMNAASELAKDGIECEVIDPRTLVPLDLESIINSVKKTGRLLTVEEAPHAGGWGAEIATRVTDQAIWYLEGPVVRVTLEGAIIPFSGPLEDYVIPNKDRVIAAAKRMLVV